MTNTLTVKPVEFLGDTLMAAQDAEGNIWAGASWICNGLGLTKGQKDRQVMNIQADEVLMEGCLKFEAGVFDPNNETLAIKLDFIPLWLAKITITPAMRKDNANLADRLKQYQLKAKDVLAAAFLPEAAQPQGLSAIERLKLQSQAILELDERTAYIEEKLGSVEDKVDNQILVDHGQQRALQGIVAKKAYERAAIIYPPDQVKESVKLLFPAIYRDLKNRFGVASYRDIRRADLADAIKLIEAWIEPASMRNGGEEE